MVCVPRRQLTEVMEKRDFLHDKIMTRWSTLSGVPIPEEAEDATQGPSNVVATLEEEDEAPQRENEEEEQGIFEDSLPKEALEDEECFSEAARAKHRANALSEKAKMAEALKWWSLLKRAEEKFDPSKQPLVTFKWTKFPTFKQPRVLDHATIPAIAKAVVTPVHAGGRRLFVGHEGDEPISLTEFDVRKDLKVKMFAIILYEELQETEKYGVGLVKDIRRRHNKVNVQWHVPKRAGVPPQENAWKIWKRSLFEVPLDTVQWATFMNKNKTFKNTERNTVKHILDQIAATGAVDLRPGLIADPEDDEDDA